MAKRSGDAPTRTHVLHPAQTRDTSSPSVRTAPFGTAFRSEVARGAPPLEHCQIHSWAHELTVHRPPCNS